jgi:hypothetical protein
MAQNRLLAIADSGCFAEKSGDFFEDADEALRGALAIQIVLSGADQDEHSDDVRDGLLGGLRVLLASARESLAGLKDECWNANASLGKYGEDARARAIGGSGNIRAVG